MSTHQAKFSGKVLIVDDDAMIRMLASEAMKQAGFEVRAIDDGNQVATLLTEYTPDILLLDVLMPGMDGYAVCDELRKSEHGAEIPVLMMTGLDDLESIQAAYQAGATDFITKPIHWQVLPYRVQYLIRTSNTYKELKSGKILLSQAQHLAGIGSWDWDLASDTFVWSDELHRIVKTGSHAFGNSSDSFFGLVHPLDQELVRTALDSALAGRTTFSVDHRVILPSGPELYVHTEATVEYEGINTPRRMLGIVQDISDRKRTEEQVRYLAYYDSLTGLPNRTLFNDRLEQALRRSERTGQGIAVFFIDLDDFKLINDTHGHRVGDLLLEEVARRLDKETRAVDTLARLGGDEFTILLHDIKSEENALLVACKHLNSLLGAYHIEEKQLFISASIGIALYPDHGDSVEKLIKSADAAMYQAKEQGKNHIEVFTQALYNRVSERLWMLDDMRRALEQHEFVLHYQPRINLLTGHWSGVEALIRWQHPQRGIISPLDFIPLAEETGLIMQIGEWVLREACQQLHRWHLDGIRLPRVSVNVSPLQFRRQNIVELVRSALSDACLCTQALELEITESALMDDMQQSITVLQKLKQMGINISIDDFGTGYSSLSSLRNLPVNILKVDRSFITQCHTSEDDAQILSAIIAMAHSLRMSVVAEGVECEKHEALLLTHQCREAQGYLYARPMPAEELSTLLVNGSKLLEPTACNVIMSGQQLCCLIQEPPVYIDNSAPDLICLELPGRPPACNGTLFCQKAVP